MTILGLIGLGPMGKNYLQVVNQIPNCKIQYICSRKSSSLKKFQNDRVKLNDYKKLANFPLNGIIIATPSNTHKEIAAFFIKKKVPILIEKPLALSYQDAKSLKLLQNKNKTKVLVGHTLLYNPGFRSFKKIVEKVGFISSIEFEGANNNPRKDDSVLYDWGSHGVSLIIDILDQDPIRYKIISYSKKIGQVEKINAEMTFKKKVVAKLNLNWKSKIKTRKITVIGSKGEATFDDLSNKKISLRMNNSSTTHFPEYSLEQPLVLELKEFVNAIKKRGLIYSDINYGLRVVKILDRIENLISH